MLTINAIKFTVHTSAGTFGRTIKFSTGLNIIRANNTTGKSSLFGAILYGLGFEELLGSRNDKAMQSVFKSLVREKLPNKEEAQANVVQSEILLEITNGSSIITTKRFVVNNKIKPQAIEIIHGPAITAYLDSFEQTQMYIHDKGAASNESIGFHHYLEDYLGHPLPEVVNQEGKKVKLYLPLLAAAYFIEQKSGWSDFFANIPYYGIRDAQSKVFEYILNLDVFQQAVKRSEINKRHKDIEANWNMIAERLRIIMERGGGEVMGLPASPAILSKDIRPYGRFHRLDKSFMLNELIDLRSSEYDEIMQLLHSTISANLENIQDRLLGAQQQAEEYELLLERYSTEVNQDRERLRQYSLQRENVQQDISKNKDAEKLQRLGFNATLKVAVNVCPACSQDIMGTLLPESLNIAPMRIDENLKYLESQKKMTETFIVNLRDHIKENETKVIAITESLREARQRIRTLKRDLTSDDRLPSEEIIERKIILEREIGLLKNIRAEFTLQIEAVYKLSEQYEKVKIEESQLPAEYHSANDSVKLKKFQENFKSLLKKVGFESKPIDSVGISNEKYTPVHGISDGSTITRPADIRFDTSASDFIRSQWAYYTSLLKTSLDKKGNHIGLLVFDEPQQQSAATENFKAFLEELENFSNAQIIVLASFQNSEQDFIEATKGLVFARIIDLVSSGDLMITRTIT